MQRNYLEDAVKDAAALLPKVDWTSLRTKLTQGGFGVETVDTNRQQIMLWAGTVVQTSPIPISNPGTLPLSPESEASLHQTRSHSSSLDSQGVNEVRSSPFLSPSTYADFSVS